MSGVMDHSGRIFADARRADVTPTAVIQVKQGIGDVIWHLPFIRAIAATEPAGAVIFLAPPSSHARELLQGEACIAQVIHFEHGGSELRRGVNLVRLVGMMRRARFQKIWILDRTVRPALAALLAGIPQRIGVGFAKQRRFITNPGIDETHFHDMPIEWLRALMPAMGVPLASTEPNLALPEAILARVAERYRDAPRPWIVLAPGASHPSKDWPAAHWRSFVEGLRQRTPGTVFLIGGPDNAARAAELAAGEQGARAVDACDLRLVESAALLRHADLFVGPDSGPMNLAVAGETPAFGLFGSTPVLRYSRFIHAVEPPDGQAADGMTRIDPALVLARIEPYLNAVKA
jgi:heptosyltransferase-2